ncbi:GNAT family N-acetyltransferase [Brevibacillus sp. H7]|uniref:GNAT family N-acetyltransferase n=1 Tax=Brevibacillus sp. H7 TaxID=3349138 RepID=UPI0038176EFB
MNYTVEPLGPVDNQALLELARLSHTGSDQFIVDRAPDFFALGCEWGEPRYFGLMREDRLIGCIGVTRQVRFLHGREQDVYYLHDLRVHPHFASTRAYYRLLNHVMQHLRAHANWVFATVLDSNEHRLVLTRGGSLLPSAVPIGRTVHCGVPLFLPLSGNWQTIRAISPKTAWDVYAAWARPLNFAPADHTRFRFANGIFLGAYRKGQLVAVCKVVNQAVSRRLVLSKPLPLSFRLLNVLCRLRGTPLLPQQGGVFHHGYLAYYVSVDGSDMRRDFLAYLSRSHRAEFTYVFFGLPNEAASSYKGPLNIRLGSTTYAYGEVPNGISMHFHELTMI